MSAKSRTSDRESTYLIVIVGELRAAALNRASPYELTRVEAGETTTMCSVTCDQAGLIGVLRYLHGLGFVLQSAERVSTSVLR